MFQQLGGTDASFLYMETLKTPMHIGGLYLYELPAGYQGDFYEDFKKHIVDRLHRLPMLTRKLIPMPFQIDNPLWGDEDNMEIDYHIRRVTLPHPGTPEQLEKMVGRLHSNFLDRSRPLWEFYIIDGLADGRIAEYTKFHHAALDGAAGVALVKAIYDISPVPAPVEPAPLPKDVNHLPANAEPRELIRVIVENYWRQQIRNIQWIPDVMKAIADLVLPNTETLKPELPRQVPQKVPKTSLNSSVTSQRVFAGRSLPLKDVKTVAKMAGVKLNDVVLAMCASALRRYFVAKGELPAEPLVAYVPVSLREAGDDSMGNQVFGMLCSLATHVADPIERLRLIIESSAGAKRITRSIRHAIPRDFNMFGMSWIMQGFADLISQNRELADKLPPFANVIISNVPGPAMPMFLAGARMLSQYPVSIPTHGMALNITVQSYHDTLDIGLTACRTACPEVSQIADDIVAALPELVAALQAAAPVPAVAEKKPVAEAEPAPATPLPAAAKASPAAKTAASPSAREKPPAPAKAVRTKAAAAKAATPAPAKAATPAPAKATKATQATKTTKAPEVKAATVPKSAKTVTAAKATAGDKASKVAKASKAAKATKATKATKA